MKDVTININPAGFPSQFASDKENIRIRTQEYGTTNWEEWEESEILKLTNSEFWIKDSETVNNETTETIIHFAKV